MEAVATYIADASAASVAAEVGMSATAAPSTFAALGSTASTAAGWGSTLSNIGTGLSVLGTIGGASARAGALERNAKVAQQNAALAIGDSERQAYYIKRQADLEAAQMRSRQQRAQSSRSAIVGASGLDMAGSPLQVMEGADYLGEMDVQKILSGGQINADNALLRGKRQAGAQMSQATIDETQAGTTLTSGFLSAGSTIARAGARKYGYSTGNTLEDLGIN